MHVCTLYSGCSGSSPVQSSPVLFQLAVLRTGRVFFDRMLHSYFVLQYYTARVDKTRYRLYLDDALSTLPHSRYSLPRNPFIAQTRNRRQECFRTLLSSGDTSFTDSRYRIENPYWIERSSTYTQIGPTICCSRPIQSPTSIFNNEDQWLVSTEVRLHETCPPHSFIGRTALRPFCMAAWIVGAPLHKR